MSPRSLRFLFVLGATIAVALSFSVHARLDAQATADRITPPVRHAPPPQPPVPPPAVPATADTLPPLTLTITTRLEQPGQPPRVTRQTMLRTVDRVLVVIDGTDSEWLFERNPVDHRRVSGSLIDHKASRILIHQESDLRLGQQLRGWMDVLTLRFDTSALAALEDTGEARTANGVTFARYADPKPGARGIAEVWWSAALLLPERLTIRENAGPTTSTIESFVRGVDETKLAAPAMRFPSYRVLDVTDARDGQ